MLSLDNDIDWKQLNEATAMVASFMRSWGRFGVFAKVKYGTSRIRPCFWDGTLFELLYLRTHYSACPEWLWRFDSKYIGRFMQWTKIVKLIHWYQSKIYRIAYRRAIKAFPRVKIALVVMANYPELIEEYDVIMTMGAFHDFYRKLFQLEEDLYENFLY